jgi:hypothetical protein
VRTTDSGAGKGPLHHPPPRQNREAALLLLAGDDLHEPAADGLGPVDQVRLVPLVDPDEPQPGKRPSARRSTTFAPSLS